MDDNKKILFRFYMNKGDLYLSYEITVVFILITIALFVGIISPPPSSILLYQFGILFVTILVASQSIAFSIVIELHQEFLCMNNFILKTSKKIYYNDIQKVIIIRSVLSKGIYDFADIKIVSNNKKYMLFVSGLMTSKEYKTQIYQLLKERIGNRWDELCSENN